MTVKDLNNFKNGKKVCKHKWVIDFYKTNPSDEQERLRSIIAQFCLFSGVICGFALGICLACLLL